MADRFGYDEKGNLDDVVVEDVEMFRLEYMDKGIIWMRCYRAVKQDVVFWLNGKGQIKGRHEIE